MFCAYSYTSPRYQVTIYRTSCPLVFKLLPGNLLIILSLLKLLASILFEIFCLQKCTLILLKGNNSSKGDNYDKKKKVQVLFDEDSISYEISNS